MDLNKCSICLLENSQLININEVDLNNVKWYNKIILIVPELEQFEDYLICNSCTQKLEEYVKFKQMLLNILARWSFKYHSTFIHKNVSPKSDEICDFGNQKNVSKANEICHLNNQMNNKQESYDDCNSDDVKEFQSEILDNPQSSEGHDENYIATCTKNCNNKYKLNITNSFECNNCNNFYANFKNLQAHQMYCVGHNSQSTLQNMGKETTLMKTRGSKSLRTFICEVCEEKFNKSKLIINHYLTVHSYNIKSIKPYACDRCEQKFSALNLLHQHLKYHEKDRTEMCTTCGKSFITSSDLISHQYIHLNRRNYKCKKCNKAFNTNKNLRTHILVVHTDRSMWRYHCEVCDKKFPQKSNYDLHIRRHTGDKQHVCQICQKTFVSSSELKRHVQLHSNIKLFTCHPCGTEYKTIRYYKQHVERKHSDTTKVQKNLAMHSGLKSYPCSKCDKKFSEKNYQKQHLEIVHGIKEIV